MAFPQTPLDVRTDLQIGGTWADVTADTYLRDLISITRGRADEAARPDPSKATITFNNRSGRYSPRNPVGPYYGQFGRNTPVRISVPAQARYLRLAGDSAARASTPDATALDIVGDLDVRVDTTLMSWDTGVAFIDLVGKFGADGNQSWRLSITPTGGLQLAWTPDGTLAAQLTGRVDTPLPVPPSGRLSVRATLDVNNGASGNTVAFYTSTTAGTAGPWTLFGTATQAGTTSVFNSTATLDIGDVTGTVTAIAPVGKVHAAEVRNGIAGTVVASPVFSTPAAGASSFADSSGRTWSMSGGAEISDRDYRFHGEVSSWPSKWDVSGRDRYVPVEAAGILRRLGAGTDPLQSTLRRRIPSATSLIAYWPFEDGSTATRAASAISRAAAMSTTGLTFAADDTLPGSSSLPTVAAGATIKGAVPTSPTGAWHQELVYRIDTAPAGDANQALLSFTTTAGVTWRVGIGATLLHLTVATADGTALLDSTIVPAEFFGAWARFSIQASQSGGSVSYAIEWTMIGGASKLATGSYSGQVGSVSGISTTFGAGLDGMSLGHVAVFNALDPVVFDSADTGFAGEQAHARIYRLCQEEGIPVSFPGGTGPTAPMGPQRPAALLDLLGECADADMGVLFELREFMRLAYRRRSSFYNQPTAVALDYAVSGHVAPPLEPVDDDQKTRNNITVNRVSGSSAVAQDLDGPLSVNLPPGGIGPVPGGGTYNVAGDDQLPDLAGWLLHLGTVNDSRYPSVHIDLAAGASLIPSVQALNVGDRVTIAHPPPECGGVGDTLDLLVQGYTETLGAYDWDLMLNCTPGSAWQVAVLDDPGLSRNDTDSSRLAAGVNATATSVQVTVATGPFWVTTAAYPTEFPFDIRVAGEQMTVTGITGASSPQTFTVIRSVNGVVKNQSAAADVRLAVPMILAL